MVAIGCRVFRTLRRWMCRANAAPEWTNSRRVASVP